MAGPGDAVLAEHPFAHRAQLLDGADGTAVARVDSEFDAGEAGVEGPTDGQRFDATIESGPTRHRRHIGPADLQPMIG